jgi:hypothetical protein
VNQRVTLPEGLSDEALAKVLAPYSGAKWLHFEDVRALGFTFKQARRKAAYEAWLARVEGSWCCRDAQGGAVGEEEDERGGAAPRGAGAAAGERVRLQVAPAG